MDSGTGIQNFLKNWNYPIKTNLNFIQNHSFLPEFYPNQETSRSHMMTTVSMGSKISLEDKDNISDCVDTLDHLVKNSLKSKLNPEAKEFIPSYFSNPKKFYANPPVINKSTLANCSQLTASKDPTSFRRETQESIQNTSDNWKHLNAKNLAFTEAHRFYHRSMSYSSANQSRQPMDSSVLTFCKVQNSNSDPVIAKEKSSDLRLPRYYIRSSDNIVKMEQVFSCYSKKSESVEKVITDKPLTTVLDSQPKNKGDFCNSKSDSKPMMTSFSCDKKLEENPMNEVLPNKSIVANSILAVDIDVKDSASGNLPLCDCASISEDESSSIDKNIEDEGNSIIFGDDDDQENSMIFEDDEENSIIFGDDEENSIIFGDGDDQENSIIFGDDDDQTNSIISGDDDQENSIIFGDDEEDQENSIIFGDDEENSIVFEDSNDNQSKDVISEEEEDDKCNDESSEDDSDYDCDIFSLGISDGWYIGGALHITALITSKPSEDCCDGGITSETASNCCMDDSFLTPETISANHRWNGEIDNNCSVSTPCRVKFCSDIVVSEIEHWDRKGQWEQFTRDTMRFKRRIGELEPCISRVLDASHREKVYKNLISANSTH